VPTGGDDAHVVKNLSVAALINLWADFDERDVYFAYLVADGAPAGLEQIDSFEPVPEVELNWLNIFYAVEWAVFAGFAVFLWYRLVRDAWEREREEEADAAAAAAEHEAPGERA
jgi:surfeit locus 1 family protein